MSISRPFILRPVATSLLMAALLIAGIVAYRQLPVSALPEVDYPTIQCGRFSGAVRVFPLPYRAARATFGQLPGLNRCLDSSAAAPSSPAVSIAPKSHSRARITASITPPNLSASRISNSANLQQQSTERPVLTLLCFQPLPLTKVEDWPIHGLFKDCTLPGLGW